MLEPVVLDRSAAERDRRVVASWLSAMAKAVFCASLKCDT
jgi:hypothetical protein